MLAWLHARQSTDHVDGLQQEYNDPAARFDCILHLHWHKLAIWRDLVSALFENVGKLVCVWHPNLDADDRRQLDKQAEQVQVGVDLETFLGH